MRPVGLAADTALAEGADGGGIGGAEGTAEAEGAGGAWDRMCRDGLRDYNFLFTGTVGGPCFGAG